MSDGPEIFDDLYLGLQAGGALRKQRRGEELTDEEREALGRWQQMSMWRKGLAVGAFAVGTFGLGFTLGGLVFGRWRAQGLTRRGVRRRLRRRCPLVAEPMSLSVRRGPRSRSPRRAVHPSQLEKALQPSLNAAPSNAPSHQS